MENDKDISLIKRYISTLLAISPANFLIKETQGLIDPLIPISEEVSRQILSTIQPVVEKTCFYFGVIKIDMSKLIDPFFKSLTIDMEYVDEHVPLAEVGGSYDSHLSTIEDNEIDVFIHIGSIGQDNSFIEKLQGTIVHELAHAYDDYMETINSKHGNSYLRYENESLINREALSIYIENVGSIESKLTSVVLFILKSEREAEQNEFLSEVMRLSKMRVLEDPRHLTAYVSNTGFYKNMMRIQDRLEEIENLDNDKEKIDVTKAFNTIYKNKNVSYDEMCAYLRKQWTERKNDLFKHVAKHIAHVTETFVRYPAGFAKLIMSVYEDCCVVI